ncbi:uncharacterized protein TrAtP1_002106 [Trichoderma atroviride]|uniref:uncharacterized protein n=1 Tax=Hypocrea atroviridis TaxID=63577 RepID=UPI00331AB6AB|nr:hypothetical protein TrAtP1_002106 [Trichoderma atroviride]
MTSLISFSQTIDSWYETADAPTWSQEEEIALFLDWQGIMPPRQGVYLSYAGVVLVASINAQSREKPMYAEYSNPGYHTEYFRDLFSLFFPLWLLGDQDRGKNKHSLA